MFCMSVMEYCTSTKETWQLRRFGAPSTIEKSSSVIRLVSDSQVSVGRGPKADHFLDSLIYARLISRIHAVITGERLPDGHVRFILTNKGLNGTYINDFKLGISENNSQVLQEGDKVAFGHINCGSIKVGEYAPQDHSEFQFLFERVSSSQEDSACQTQADDPNPFFSPYPSETPVYSDTSIVPIDYTDDHYIPPSPQTTDNASAEKENKMFRSTQGVHSFDSDDVLLDEKPPCLKSTTQEDKEVGEDEVKEWSVGQKLNPNVSSPSSPDKKEDLDVFSVQQCENLPIKPLLPDVVPNTSKHDHGGDYCHSGYIDLGRTLKRSYSLPASDLHNDEDRTLYSCLTSQCVNDERSKETFCSSSCCVSGLESVESHTDIHSGKHLDSCYNSVLDNNEFGERSLLHMSKKKKYILSMCKQEDNLREGQHPKQTGRKDTDKEGRSYADVKNGNGSVSQWECLSSLYPHHKRDSDGQACAEQAKDEANVLFEKNGNDRDKNIDELSKTALHEVVVKTEKREEVDLFTFDHTPISLKHGGDLKDKHPGHCSVGIERTSPILNLDKLSEDVSDECKEKRGKDALLSKKKLKWDKLASPVVIMEKIPDNMEGKLWTHLKSKENFSTKLKSSSPSKSKSSKKRHHHKHHLNHHSHHVDHNVQVKQKSVSSHLHSSIPSPHSPRCSSSSKSFKISHSSHSSSRHKKNRPHSISPAHHSTSKATPRQNKETVPLTTKQKNKGIINPLKSDLIDKDIDMVSSKKSMLSSSSSTNLNFLTSASIKSHKNSSHTSREKKIPQLSPVHATLKDISLSTTSSLSSSSSSESLSSSLPSSPTSLPPLPPLLKMSGSDEDHLPRQTRVLSTGFFSSDLNSDDEDVRTRENSPPNKKIDIVRKIYSPSSSPKPNDKLKIKGTKNAHKGLSSKISSEQVAAECVTATKDRLKSPFPSTEHLQDEKSSTPEAPAEGSNGNPQELKKRSKENKRKGQKSDLSAKKHHDLTDKVKKEHSKPSKIMTLPTTTSSSSSSSSLVHSRHSVTPSLKSIKKAHVDSSNLETTVSESSRSNPPPPRHIDVSNAQTLLISDKNSIHAKVSPSPSPPSSRPDKLLHNSKKRKCLESNDLNLKTKSNSAPKSVPGGSSSSKLSKESPRLTTSSFNRTKMEHNKKSHKLLSNESANENSSARAQDKLLSQNGQELKNTKNQTQTPDKGSLSAPIVQSQPQSRHSSTEKKINLKRPATFQEEVGEDLNLTPPPPKQGKESSELLKKRLLFKNIVSSSSSSSSSTSSDSSSSSSSPPSLLLFSEKFPPNKSKNGGDHLKREAKVKKNQDKADTPTPTSAKLRKSFSACGKSSSGSVKKLTSRSYSSEDTSAKQSLSTNQVPKPSPKPSPMKQTKVDDRKHQELFSLALDTPKPERPKEKRSSKGSDNKSEPSKSVNKVLRKQGSVKQQPDEDSKLNPRRKKNPMEDHQGMKRSLRPQPGQARSTKQDNNRPLSRACKKTGGACLKTKKRKSKWPPASYEEDFDDGDSFDVITEEEEGEDWNLEDGVEYCNEPCQAKTCSNPVGPKVDWVMCDTCEGWYHIVCVNTTLEQIAKDGDQFQCGFC